MWLHVRAMDACGIFVHVRVMDDCGISVQFLVFINTFVVFINIFFDVNLFKKVSKIQKTLMIHTVRWSPFANTGWDVPFDGHPFRTLDERHRSMVILCEHWMRHTVRWSPFANTG